MISAATKNKLSHPPFSWDATSEARRDNEDEEVDT